MLTVHVACTIVIGEVLGQLTMSAKAVSAVAVLVIVNVQPIWSIVAAMPPKVQLVNVGVTVRSVTVLDEAVPSSNTVAHLTFGPLGPSTIWKLVESAVMIEG